MSDKVKRTVSGGLPERSRGRISRFGGWGVMAVAVLLSIGLAALGVLNRRTTERTAQLALEGRALELGLSTAGALLLMRPRGPIQMQDALGLLTGDTIRAADVVSDRGRVIASTATDRRGERLPRSPRLRQLRRRKALHLVARLSGVPKPTYEVWIMLRPGGRGHGGRARRWERWRRQRGKGQGTGMAGPGRNGLGGGGPGRGRLGRGGLGRGGPGMAPASGDPWRGRPPWGRSYLRLRIQVTDRPIAAAVARARFSQLVTLSASGVLFLLALLLFFADRRAVRLHREMDRQRALAEMGEMAAVLAHEIRNPLGVIKGHAQLLAEKADPAAREKLTLLVAQSGRLERLVNALLDYARPAPLALQSVDAKAVVAQATELVVEDAVSREVALVQDLEEGRIEADADQLLQVVLNLLRNGLQASPRGASVTVRLRFRGHQMVFEVIDDGPGLPGPEAGDIFKPFVTTRAEGSGLGLAISRRIAEAHGGGLTASNVPARGARFVLTLPLRPPHKGEHV